MVRMFDGLVHIWRPYIKNRCQCLGGMPFGLVNCTLTNSIKFMDTNSECCTQWSNKLTAVVLKIVVLKSGASTKSIVDMVNERNVFEASLPSINPNVPNCFHTLAIDNVASSTQQDKHHNTIFIHDNNSKIAQ